VEARVSGAISPPTRPSPGSQRKGFSPAPAGGGGPGWGQEPWLAHLREFVPALDAPDRLTALNIIATQRGVNSASGLPLRFVAPDDAGTVAYEAHIHATGRVPTRDNAHDFFNALAWLALPRTKAALNARQAEEIARTGIGNRRGPARDAATLIDESGLLVATDDATMFDALHAHDWPALFLHGRERWGTSIRVVAFGHALLEKLAMPFKAIAAAVVPLPACTDLAAMDAAAARFVQRADLAPRLLPNLPVLGIPGWWADNVRPDFYVDAAVFRPAHGASRT
jgi:hypothetical protein